MLKVAISINPRTLEIILNTVIGLVVLIIIALLGLVLLTKRK